MDITNHKQHSSIEHQSVDAVLLKDVSQSLSEIQKGKYIEFDSTKEFKEKLSQYAVKHPK